MSRPFGFLANRRCSTLLPLCSQLLGSTPEPQADLHAFSTEDSPDLYHCPKCVGSMKIIEQLTAAEIQPRSRSPLPLGRESVQKEHKVDRVDCP
jgi:hypothetical protein